MFRMCCERQRAPLKSSVCISRCEPKAFLVCHYAGTKEVFSKRIVHACTSTTMPFTGEDLQELAFAYMKEDPIEVMPRAPTIICPEHQMSRLAVLRHITISAREFVSSISWVIYLYTVCDQTSKFKAHGPLCFITPAFGLGEEE